LIGRIPHTAEIRTGKQIGELGVRKAIDDRVCSSGLDVGRDDHLHLHEWRGRDRYSEGLHLKGCTVRERVGLAHAEGS
jgi:hypothetical protein